MKPFEIRLAQQHARNAAHLRNLRSFCDNQHRFSMLHPDDQALLLQQLEHMACLDSILEKRMRRLNIPV